LISGITLLKNKIGYPGKVPALRRKLFAIIANKKATIKILTIISHQTPLFGWRPTNSIHIRASIRENPDDGQRS
jgi:hypothetical protein